MSEQKIPAAPVAAPVATVAAPVAAPVAPVAPVAAPAPAPKAKPVAPKLPAKKAAPAKAKVVKPAKVAKVKTAKPAKAKKEGARSRVNDRTEQVIAQLNKGVNTQPELVKKLGCQNATVNQILHRLIKAKQCSRTKEGRSFTYSMKK